MSVKVYGPDGVLRISVDFSTSVAYRFFSGTLPTNAAEIQISINGSDFSSDPSLAQWGDGDWMVPNPKYEALGLELLSGENTVEVRAILPSGTTTPTCKAVARLVAQDETQAAAQTPTNISLIQKDNSVEVVSEGPSDPTTTSLSTSVPVSFRGVNFYASEFPGGGSSGYFRLNGSLVSTGTTTQETSKYATLSVDVDVASDSEGDHLSDPQYFRMIGQQENSSEIVLQADYNQRFEIPETASKMKVATEISTVRDVTLYKFSHNRGGGANTITISSLQALPSDQPLYYVVSATYYDSASNLEYESAFSEEVAGHPLKVTSATTSIPMVTRQEVVRSFVSNVFSTNPQVKVESGSVLRDTVIDPFSSQAERLRFIFDFFQRARTPSLLLQVDDPNNSGISIPPSQSPYKRGLRQALFLTSDSSVQIVIDSAFDSMANNFGISRKAGSRAIGEVTFYTLIRPTSSLTFPMGTQVTGGGASFVTTRFASIDSNQLASFFDPISGRYEVTVPVRATQSGSQGNLAAGQVSTLATSVSGGARVVNTSMMTGGSSSESNYELAQRVSNRLASVDSGTAQGYLQIAAGTPGVIKANVVDAGDPLMYRDIYQGSHKGGKVDVWVQGSNLATMTDTFAFMFEIANDFQFEIVGDPGGYLFRAADPLLTAASPIVEMLNYPASGYSFTNVTTGEVFDLTGVTYPTYDTIQLSTLVPQPEVTLTDVCLGSYRRRVASEYTLPRQPVSSITSVVGEVSGNISSFYLEHPEAPLEDGLSMLANDFLQIVPVTNTDGTITPSGNLIQVTSEPHVMLGSYPEYLDKLGAVYLSIVVQSPDGVTTYRGPDDPSGVPDYTINLGTPSTAVSIVRTLNSSIPSGATVNVSYSHDENFTVGYIVNLIVPQAQQELDATKHATADVLVKAAVPIPLDIAATVVTIAGRQASDVDQAIRTNLANFFNTLRLSDPVRQSDIVELIENANGVSYVAIPLTTLVPQAGAPILREVVSTDLAAESTILSTLSSNSSVSYLLNNPLSFATVDGGGAQGAFVGIFQDDTQLSLVGSVSQLSVTTGQSYIIGDAGLIIQGFSDDETLTANGYVTPDAQEVRRKFLTSNKVIITLPPGESPLLYRYAVTYSVGEGSGPSNVDPGKAQYCSAGTFTFTYDTDLA